MVREFLHAILKSKRARSPEFAREFQENLANCDWQPHPLYSVFTQYDQEWYLEQREAFLHKYRCFYAVSRTLQPKKIIELGACAGSGADAYLGGSPGAKYIGLDVFGVNFRHDDGSQWDPYKIAEQLFTDRKYKEWQLIRTDLRSLDRLPTRSDFVVVDAAHDFENEYADLRLALTAKPEFIFVDDADDENAAKPAIEKFLEEDLADRVDFTFPVDYVGGGLVIKLRKSGNHRRS